MTQYRIPVSDQLLEQRESWPPIDGFRLLSVDGPWLAHPQITICTVEDDNADPSLEGKLVELSVKRSGYLSQRIVLDGKQPKLMVRLEREKGTATAVRPRPAPARPPSPPQTEAPKPKPRPQVGGGEIVNPWAK